MGRIGFRKGAFLCLLALAGCSGGGDAGEAGGIDAARLVEAGADSANWLSYGRTYDEQRFSPLDQIGTANVADLGLAWYADMDSARGQEATPIVIDGKIYITTAWSRVKAYDGQTGKLLWEYAVSYTHLTLPTSDLV